MYRIHLIITRTFNAVYNSENMEDLENLSKEELERILVEETAKLHELEAKAKAASELPIKIVIFILRNF